jgi:hypothetical protein
VVALAMEHTEFNRMETELRNQGKTDFGFNQQVQINFHRRRPRLPLRDAKLAMARWRLYP